ncbi:protein MAINTENANCE OF MERISTEMS-like [Camellia sinensis]|uniref:protein MAINTENANCE OF MERISTEMS-like n=1 Tax=Camellia sinensis TaxID=4442 RepID=UPI001035E9E9|nr:protein MAINTENANCE OF MERISTEMS-like [Camellia sinensis]
MSGLAHLIRCTYRFVNKIVVSSFVERWQPETNTFHLTVGDMTITLDDVVTILGFPIVGKSISVQKLSERGAIALVVNTLEIDAQEVRHEMSSARGNLVRLEWLRAHFHNVTDNDSMERIACADLTTISSYTWGVAALAYLYRQKGYASRSGMKKIAGYMTLLEEWIYEHFRGFQPHLNMNYTQDMPHVYRWTSRREFGEKTQLQAFREELDRLFETRTRVAEMSIRITQLRFTTIYLITHPFIEVGYKDSVQHPDILYYAIDAIEQFLQD